MKELRDAIAYSQLLTVFEGVNIHIGGEWSDSQSFYLPIIEQKAAGQ